MIPGVRQIYIDGSSRGLVELPAIYERAAREAPTEPTARGAWLAEQAAKHNYIPDKVRAEYAAALELDYRVWRGELTPEQAMAAAGAIEVRILGAGCPRCERLHALALEILGEMDMAADVAHVKDLTAIAAYGPVATPALLVNGRVVVSGGLVPGKASLAARLREALGASA